MADYHSLLTRAVANLPNAGTPATRAAIYGRARKALLEQLRSLRPPLPESDITREEKALDAAIAEIEGRHGSQDPAPPPASAPPAPTSPAAGKPGAAPAKAVPAASSTGRCPAPHRACCARAVRGLGAIAFANGSAKPTRGRKRAYSGSGAAPSAAIATAQPTGREPAASANPDCGEARSGPNGGFAGSIPAGCCDGQPAFRPVRSAGRGEGRQG